MKCPECEANGQKSQVYERSRTMTLVAITPSYDEEGRAHIHEANTTTTDFECSNGHRFTLQESPEAGASEQDIVLITLTREQADLNLRVVNMHLTLAALQRLHVPDDEVSELVALRNALVQQETTDGPSPAP